MKKKLPKMKKKIRVDIFYQKNLLKFFIATLGDKNIEIGFIVETTEKVLAIISAYLCKYEFNTFSLVIDS